jgi:peptidoglycan/xylan/chitin deacetylase (PgdA/CDA1 family)
MSRQKKFIIFLFLAALSMFLLALFLKQRYTVPILMYHSVSLTALDGERLAVTPQTFRRQMEFLKKHHYNVIPLRDLVDIVRHKKRIPRKTVVITFDDGYKDNYTQAFPVLKEYGFSATIFVIIDELGRSRGDRLNWQELQEMQASGLITIGSHGVNARPLVNIKDTEGLISQILLSKRILEDRLNKKVDLFSYPEGAFNAKIRQLVIDAGYCGAVATGPGKEYPNDDVFALKRLRISENAASMFVFAIETSGFYTFMKEFRRK